MDKEWATNLVAEQIDKYLKAKVNEGEEHRINMIVTFDEYGVSSHPNHKAVNRGVCKVI